MLNYFINDWQSDCVILTSYLDEVEYYAGTERRTKQFKDVKIGKGCGSMLFGYTWKGYLKKDKITKQHIYREKSKYTGLYLTKCKAMYPQLDDIFKEFSNLYFENFKWTQVQMNKNYQCSPHFDSSNIGESILLTLGDYTGGETIVEIDNDKIIYNSHNNLIKFNGSKYKHWTTDFSGKRYALVFFNNNKLLLSLP
tara:strand:- start:579 stop:1166 length:588 start_codon:yes stop_codon:yes gene_type:complete